MVPVAETHGSGYIENRPDSVAFVFVLVLKAFFGSVTQLKSGVVVAKPLQVVVPAARFVNQ